MDDNTQQDREEEEEDDVHICGLCRAQFSDVQEFINHKKGTCPVRQARKHKQQQSYRGSEASTNAELSSNGLMHSQGSTDELSRVDMMGKGDNTLTIQLNQEGETIGYLQFSNLRSDLNQASLPQPLDTYSQDLYGQGDPNNSSHEYVLLPNSSSDEAYTKQNDITFYQAQPHTQMQPSYSQNVLQAGHNTEYTQSFDCPMLNHHAMQDGGDSLELSDSLHSSIQTMPLPRDEKLLYNMNKEPYPVHGSQTGDPYNKPVSGLMRQLLTKDPKDPQCSSGGGLGQEMPLQSHHHDHMEEAGADPQSDENRAFKLPVAMESKHLKKAKQKSTIVKTMKEKNFVCEVKDCTYRTAYLKDLERHMRLHTGERPYKCDRCDKIFSRSDKLQVHLRYHLNERSFKCSLCPYSSVEKGTLNKHMMVHKDEKPFSCQLCTYKCRNRTQLSIHLRIHTGDQPYHCTMCDAVFKVNSDLSRHIRIHTGEKPYCCKFQGCDYKCAIKSNLKSHYRIHHKNEQEQLACKSCSFTTSSKKAYKEHVKGHSVVEDLICKECNYQCANKTSLRNHQKLHTKETFQCSFCSYAAKQKGNLLTHIERKHAKVVLHKSSKSKGKSKLKELKSKLAISQQTEECVSPRKGNVKSKCVKSFECSQCKATFVREEALKCHVKQHKETSLSTAYAVLKLQQPVINDSSTQSPATNSSVVTDGVNGKFGQSLNREKIALTNNQNIEPLMFSTGKGFVASSSTEALDMSSPEKALPENLDLGVTVQNTNPMLASPSAVTYSIHGNVTHSQATLGINDILIAAGLSGVNSNSNSPTAGMKDIQLGSMAQSVSGNLDISQSGKNFLLAQSPQDVPSVQVLQNISLPYIKLPNGQVLILTGQTNQTVNSSNVVVDNSSSFSDIQLQSFVQQPVYNTEQIIQCAADSTTSAPMSASNQAFGDNPDQLSSQQHGAIPIQIILPNDSQQTLPIVSQLLSSVLNRNVSEDGNQLQLLQATSQGSGSHSMQSFVIQIPSQAGSIKDAAGNNVQESQSFVLQIPTSKFDL